MKTIIAGGRDFEPSTSDWKLLDEFKESIPITVVVCGMARGADEFGRLWAVMNKIPVKPFPADWNKHGKSAGPIRNNEMAEYAEALVAFHGGAGTNHMLSAARKKGLVIEKIGRH